MIKLALHVSIAAATSKSTQVSSQVAENMNYNGYNLLSRGTACEEGQYVVPIMNQIQRLPISMHCKKSTTHIIRPRRQVYHFKSGGVRSSLGLQDLRSVRLDQPVHLPGHLQVSQLYH